MTTMKLKLKVWDASGQVQNMAEFKEDSVEADYVNFTEGFAVFEKYVPVEGQEWKDTVFIRAIRAEHIEEIVRTDT